MNLIIIAKVARPARTVTRKVDTLLPFAITSHLVLDNDTGTVVGVQRSMTFQGRAFATATVAVPA